MIYNITDRSKIICSTDGSIKNMVDPFVRWEVVDDMFILTEAGELYFQDKTYEIAEPSIVFVTYRIDNDNREIIIIPCKDAINKLVDLKNRKKEFEKNQISEVKCSKECESC